MEPTKIELEIMAAAKQLFLEKGFAATSTTDIARKAGCNQALIHYYYRTKENLFEKIYLAEVNNTLSIISTILDEPIEGLSIEEIIDRLIDTYFLMLRDNPKVPFFLVQELIINSERRESMRQLFILNPLRQEAYEKYKRLVYHLHEMGKITDIDPFNLLISVISLVATTFLSLPLYADLLQRTLAEQETYLSERKQEIKRMLISRLRP